MQIISVPEAVAQQAQLRAGDISFVNYKDRGNQLFKNYVVFNQYAISFILNGQKDIYLRSTRTQIGAGEAMLIPAGHSIIAEHSLNDEPYNSFIVFFPAQRAIDFLNRYPAVHTEIHKQQAPPYILFPAGAYLQEYSRSICMLIASGHQLSEAVAQHKLEELLLVLYESHPALLASLFQHNRRQDVLSLKRLVENNLFNNLSLDEMAFLSHRSRSTFKRDFEKAFGCSPQKYVREKKLEAARNELNSGKQASELYLTYGYESLSSFCTAFKRKYGQAPASYFKELV